MRLGTAVIATKRIFIRIEKLVSSRSKQQQFLWASYLLLPNSRVSNCILITFVLLVFIYVEATHPIDLEHLHSSYSSSIPLIVSKFQRFYELHLHLHWIDYDDDDDDGIEWEKTNNAIVLRLLNSRDMMRRHCSKDGCGLARLGYR